MMILRLMLAAALGFGAATVAAAGAAPDWSAVPAKTVTLFYPGQASLEWVMTKGGHRGAEQFRGGKACAACHAGEEKPMGDAIAAGKKLEPMPIRGKPGSLAAKVQMAREAETLFMRLEFSEAGQPDAHMTGAPARVAVMLDGGGVPEAAHAGCWAMCHDDAQGMTNAKGISRTMHLGTPKRGAVEYWEAALGPGAPAAANGTVSDRRRETKPTTVAAEVVHKNGVWTVTLSRRLQAGTIKIVPGKRYTVAFAIDAGHTDKRFHYVSFERSLILGPGTADFVVK